MECGNAVEIGCLDCGHDWQPDDIDDPGVCPCCGSEHWKRLRCGGCRLTVLDTCDASPAGNLLQRTIDLKLALQAGVHITLDEIGADELRALQIVDEERNRYDREKEQEAQAGRQLS
ncbi:MAG: hypothetical protein SGI92_00385 [Bryobacteraceae bacterium]|nr:hypothetical protein [Bryobacteraceae bacterium]